MADKYQNSDQSKINELPNSRFRSEDHLQELSEACIFQKQYSWFCYRSSSKSNQSSTNASIRLSTPMSL